MKLRLLLPTALFSSFLLISCGGGDGDKDTDTSFSGVTTEATVTSANSEDLAVAATAGAGQAIAEDVAQDAAFRPSAEKAFILEFSETLRRYVTTANRTANEPIQGICSSGSVDATSNDDGTLFTMIFTNCVIEDGDGERVNGKVVVTTTDDTFESFTLRYINFTVTVAGETYTLNTTMTCNQTGCNWTSDFTGPDGRTYRTENASVSFNGSSYSVSATVYDPDSGYIQISGNVSVGNCGNGMPYPGSINFSGSAGSSGSVSYDSCDQFTVTVDGVSTTYNWADII